MDLLTFMLRSLKAERCDFGGVAQNAIVFRDIYLQCSVLKMHGIIIAWIKLSEFRLLSSMNRRLTIKRSDV